MMGSQNKNLLIFATLLKIFKFIFVGNYDANNMFVFLRVYSLYKISGRFILGVLNIPKSNISGVISRSVYRQHLTSQLRMLLFGGGFFQSKNWGLGNYKFDEKKLNNSRNC